MSAIGRRVCFADGLADGVGCTAAGFVVADALAWPAWPALPAGGADIPVTEAGACDVAATADAVVLEVDSAFDRSDVVLDTTGVTDTVGVAARVGEDPELVAAGLDGAVVTAGDAWLSAAAAD
jgi:hypothetical protein